MITKKWELGIGEQNSYAVLSLDGTVLLECGGNRELAQHVIDIHNVEIERKDRVIKGIQFCDKHGGYGFSRDCLECNK